MIWLVAEIWIYLLAAFALGVGAGWAAGAARRASPEFGDRPVAPSTDFRPGEAPPAQAPRLLDLPENGPADDLTQIIGVSEATAQNLQALGVFHFSQIAGWSDAHARWIESQIGEPGRVNRERWIEQARGLCETTSAH
ncbi:MAG: hypothetical protein AAFX08_07115 [Pseudomonadota bacterium]